VRLRIKKEAEGKDWENLKPGQGRNEEKVYKGALAKKIHKDKRELGTFYWTWKRP
jgi:hypothetical protein